MVDIIGDIAEHAATDPGSVLQWDAERLGYAMVCARRRQELSRARMGANKGAMGVVIVGDFTRG